MKYQLGFNSNFRWKKKCKNRTPELKKLCWIEGALDHSLRRIMHHQFKNSNVLHQFDCYFRLLRNNKGFETSNATPSITKLRLLKFQTFMAISFLREMENNGQLLVSGVFVIFMETKKQIRSDSVYPIQTLFHVRCLQRFCC